jgi:hypothetical protein
MFPALDSFFGRLFDLVLAEARVAPTVSSIT